ncbi:nuclease-related domain-containing protein [Cellulomonas humilata]|uniref:nuclease-related domain-containing protein n=1 Tax=Cellulomonas humilata TaxID=144055 RepID=UPI003CCD7E4D
MESVGRYGWTSLHDLHWPGRPQANLDHVALGPGGVILVDAKNWSGNVVVSDGRLRQNGYDRTSQVESVARATADLVAELAPQHRSAVRGVVCLAGQDVEPTELPWGVVVVGRAQLPAYLVSLAPRLSPYDVADAGRFLLSHLGGPVSPGVVRSAPRPRLQKRVTTKQRSSAPRSRTRQRAASRRHPSKRSILGEAALKLLLLGGALMMLVNILPRLMGG